MSTYNNVGCVKNWDVEHVLDGLIRHYHDNLTLHGWYCVRTSQHVTRLQDDTLKGCMCSSCDAEMSLRSTYAMVKENRL